VGLRRKTLAPKPKTESGSVEKAAPPQAGTLTDLPTATKGGGGAVLTQLCALKAKRQQAHVQNNAILQGHGKVIWGGEKGGGFRAEMEPRGEKKEQ